MSSFRRAAAGEAAAVYALIVERCRWMDEVGIHHWNDIDYPALFPLSYYEEMESRLYVLEEDGSLLAAAVLLEEDDRWPDEAPALYLHNFVSAVNAKGAGAELLEQTARLARGRGKTRLRLDSSEENEALTAYYTCLGFVPKGECRIGDIYHGVLRERLL